MWGPLIGAGLGLAGSLIGNKQENDGADRREREAREANERFWNMQNDYNHPSKQMSRLREANLNPNLIYGTSPSSAVGNSGSAVSPAKAAPFKFDNPVPHMMQGFDAMNTMAQTDNLRTQNTVMTQEALLKSAQRADTMVKTARSDFDLGLAKELRNTSLDAQKENLRSLKQQTLGRELDNSFKDQSLKDRLKDVKMRVDLVREQMTGQQRSNELKRLDIELRELGINPNDAWYFRIFGRNLNELMDFRESRKGKTNLDFWNN